MKIVLLLCGVMLALLLPPGLKNQSEPAFRTINIYPSDNGYTYFDSMAITSSQDFKTFLEEVSQHQLTWTNKEAFVDALLNANVDFNREALILLRYTDPNGAARVPLETPILKEKTLVCEIRREIQGAGLGIVAYHGFALAVSKSLVDKVQWKAVVGPPNQQAAVILLPTTESQPLVVRRDPPPPPTPLPGECPKLILGCPDEVLETGKTYLLKLVVEGGILKPDVSFNWSVTGAEIVGGQGTRALAVRIKGPNEIVKTWVSLGGVNPHCDAVTNSSCGPTR